jgi:glycosyltransferase involved in cell wall biosynthesis
MKAYLFLEHRFYQKQGSGTIHSSSDSVNIGLWNRYLNHFDHLIVVARIGTVESETKLKGPVVTHDKVSFMALPYARNAKEYLSSTSKLITLFRSLNLQDKFVLRLPSLTGFFCSLYLTKKRKPYVVELVGDPFDVFLSLRSSTFDLYKLFNAYRAKLFCQIAVRNADYVIYVTKEYLQKRYPPNANALTINASNVVVNENDLISEPKVFKARETSQPIKMVSVGSLDKLYKSPYLIIDAIQRVIHDGYPVELTWLGSGSHLKKIEQYIIDHKLSDSINFRGSVSHDEVLKIFEKSDLYLHIAKTEGLPRSLIEAMAKGLPAIGTRVGGIPELISEEELLLEKLEVEELHCKIIELISNPERMNEVSKANRTIAEEYLLETISLRRDKIYKALHNTD